MRYLIALAVLLAGPAFAQTGTAVLSCTAPTQFTDGTAIPAGASVSFRFYRGTTAASQTTVSPVQTSCAFTFTALAVGTHWFSATATVAGVESAKTAAVSKVVLPPVPNPPTNLTVQADLTAYVIIKSRDRVALVPVGTVAAGTACDPSQPILDKFVVPRAAVTFVSSVTDEVLVASCG